MYEYFSTKFIHQTNERKISQMPVQMFIDLVAKTTLNLLSTEAIQPLKLKMKIKNQTTLTYITCSQIAIGFSIFLSTYQLIFHIEKYMVEM